MEFEFFQTAPSVIRNKPLGRLYVMPWRAVCCPQRPVGDTFFKIIMAIQIKNRETRDYKTVETGYIRPANSCMSLKYLCVLYFIVGYFSTCHSEGGCSRLRWSGGYLGLRGTGGEDFIMKNFMICIPHQLLFGWSKKEEWDRQSMWHE